MNPRLFPMLFEYGTFTGTFPARQTSSPIARIAMYYRVMMSQ